MVFWPFFHGPFKFGHVLSCLVLFCHGSCCKYGSRFIHIPAPDGSINPHIGADGTQTNIKLYVCCIRLRLNLQLLTAAAVTTRSTQRAQTSLAEADHYSHIAHCKNVEPWLWKTTHPPQKKKKRFWIITFTTIWVCYHYYGVFLLIYLSYNTQITTIVIISQSMPEKKVRQTQLMITNHWSSWILVRSYS